MQTIETKKEEMFNRDISWLYFNERVLQEAKDPRVPLYERIKFLAIYSSNLDEFFSVRVASIRSFGKLKKKTRKELELEVKPKKLLYEIQEIVAFQQDEFGRIFREEIIPELAENNIYLVNEQQFSQAQKVFAKQYFEENEMGKLASPILLGEEKHSNPFLENKGLYFVIEFEGETSPALVNIPSESLPRFVTLPSDEKELHIAFIDDILRANIHQLFDDQIVKDIFSIKLSRDAEMYIADEFDGDLMEKIKRGLIDRNAGLPTRFLYDSAMPKPLLKYLRHAFDFSKNDLVSGGRYHNFNDFFGFPMPPNSPQLENEKLPPLPHPELEDAGSILKAMSEKDFMLHFPYQKFNYIPQLIREAAEDELVEQIKVTLYRVASDSAVANALLYAMEKGKKVFAFIETKARFDEETNIIWGERLQKAGANVRYSIPGIKVHTKLLLISRREGEYLRHYGYYGTGNFNEKTAKIYADHGLLSADQRLGEEARKVFMVLEGRIIFPPTNHLLVSPFSTRLKFEKFIDQEIANAKEGKTAYMILKMNSLEDTGMVKKLYDASQAGVKIQLIVRGICRCIPGVPGKSENIQIISIIDRFLEHARVYIFGNGGKEKMYTASADWMTRNLDKRVEVCMPIYDPKIYQELREIIDIQLRDNVKSRWVDEDQSNQYKLSMGAEKEIRAQLETYHFLASKI